MTLEEQLNLSFENAPGSAFLFGSKSKGEEFVREDSDWDLAYQYTFRFKIELPCKNWTELVNSDYYWDDQTVCILQKDNVQISLKQNINIFKMAWNSISSDFYREYFYKDSPTRLSKGAICE